MTLDLDDERYPNAPCPQCRGGLHRSFAYPQSYVATAFFCDSCSTRWDQSGANPKPFTEADRRYIDGIKSQMKQFGDALHAADRKRESSTR